MLGLCLLFVTVHAISLTVTKTLTDGLPNHVKVTSWPLIASAHKAVHASHIT